MNERQVFPLIAWQKTPAFVELYEAAVKRLEEIRIRLNKRGFQCVYLGSVRPADEGSFEAWLNPHSYIHENRDSLESVKVTAAKLGNCGWWSLDELDNFASADYEKSRIFESAMWSMNYRRSEVKAGWARRHKNDMQPQRHEGIKPRFVTSQEFDAQYLPLLVMRQGKLTYSVSFWLSCSKSGMIFAALDVNPFGGTTAVSMSAWAQQFNVRGHLNTQQEGFTLTSELIEVGQDELTTRYLLVTAALPDGSSVQQVWPTQLSNEDQLVWLAYHIKAAVLKKLANETIVQTFSFSELYTGEGWHCEYNDCAEDSYMVGLTQEEIQLIEGWCPEAMFQDRIQGSEAATFILQHNLGKVLCSKHALEVTKPVST